MQKLHQIKIVHINEILSILKHFNEHRDVFISQNTTQFFDQFALLLIFVDMFQKFNIAILLCDPFPFTLQ